MGERHASDSRYRVLHRRRVGADDFEGVDLARELPDETIAAIKAAWAQHLVLVFRDQTITQEQQLRFAARFGELGERKVAQAREELRSRASGTEQTDPRVMLVSNIKVAGAPVGAFGDGEMWFHIDSGYSARPYKYTFLYALELPSTGGHTLFSNMYRAYEAVPSALKARLAGRKALHIHEYKRSAKVDVPDDLADSLHYFHPVFITHPDTGRKTLFVDRLMTARIEGRVERERRRCSQATPRRSASGATSSTSMCGSLATS